MKSTHDKHGKITCPECGFSWFYVPNYLLKISTPRQWLLGLRDIPKLVKENERLRAENVNLKAGRSTGVKEGGRMPDFRDFRALARLHRAGS